MRWEKFKNFTINSNLFFFLAVLYMEIIVRLFTCGSFLGLGLIFMPVFSLVQALVLSAVCSAVNKKYAKLISVCVFALLFVLFSTQVTYHGFFDKYLIFFSLKAGGTGQVIAEGLFQSTVRALVNGVPAMILLAVPLAALCLTGNRNILFKRLSCRLCVIQAVIAVALHLITVVAISFIPSLSSIQSGAFDPNLSVREFGMLRTEWLDIKYNLFSFSQKTDLDEEISLPSQTEDTSSEDSEAVIDTSPNIMSIDFKTLAESETDETLKMMNSYFAEKEPTLKNEYTGMYEGYNLILLTAEGFSPYAVDKERTPTLYKMSTEGFQFTNFYTPIWGVSTSDGEYTVCTGLIPKSGVWSFYRSGNNLMRFCLGNQFRSIGVTKTFAYHNNTYNYYHRDISHPNMGYTYKAYGNGLEDYITNQWPQSDLEMIEASIGDYLSDSQPFHAYYMTVSGHLEYTRQGNSMANKNWAAVENLDCSDTLKAYYACNIELDKAMERLLAALEEAGVADKTVIAITPDHYPYGLEQDDGDKYAIWRELLGHDVETEFELYKSNFILYCPGTENAPVIDKYCSSLDILPTLSNLFGLEYDSRLLMGSDILSTAEPLVIFSDRSFITRMGRYNAVTKEFEPAEGVAFESEESMEEYVDNIKNIVSNKFKISAMILENDYYRYLFE